VLLRDLDDLPDPRWQHSLPILGEVEVGRQRWKLPAMTVAALCDERERREKREERREKREERREKREERREKREERREERVERT
jgi:hypothetical protein